MSFGTVGAFIVNTAFPDVVSGAGQFDITNRATRLTASGLTGDDVVTIEVWVGANGGQGEGAWAPLFHAGAAVQLDALNTQRVLILIGQYRAVYEGAGDVKVYAQEDTLELDGNIQYNFQQPYGSVGGGGGGGGGGFTLTAGDTDSVDLSYSGTTSSGTLTADVLISADANNAVEIRGDGLYATASTGGGFALTANDTETVNLTFTGDTSAGTLTADVLISADVGNVIEAHSDGIYAPTGSGVFEMPFLDETVDFDVAITSHAYRVTVASEGTAVASLPAATTAAGQLYIIEAEDAGTTTVTPNGTDTINGSPSSVNITTGTSIMLYCNGVDGWSLVGGP